MRPTYRHQASMDQHHDQISIKPSGCHHAVTQILQYPSLIKLSQSISSNHHVVKPLSSLLLDENTSVSTGSRWSDRNSRAFSLSLKRCPLSDHHSSGNARAQRPVGLDLRVPGGQVEAGLQAHGPSAGRRLAPGRSGGRAHRRTVLGRRLLVLPTTRRDAKAAAASAPHGPHGTFERLICLVERGYTLLVRATDSTCWA